MRLTSMRLTSQARTRWTSSSIWSRAAAARCCEKRWLRYAGDDGSAAAHACSHATKPSVSARCPTSHCPDCCCAAAGTVAEGRVASVLLSEGVIGSFKGRAAVMRPRAN
eukprot:1665155-Pleurochrysis_carterae.AAC.2